MKCLWTVLYSYFECEDSSGAFQSFLREVTVMFVLSALSFECLFAQARGNADLWVKFGFACQFFSVFCLGIIYSQARIFDKRDRPLCPFDLYKS